MTVTGVTAVATAAASGTVVNVSSSTDVGLEFRFGEILFWTDREAPTTKPVAFRFFRLLGSTVEDSAATVVVVVSVVAMVVVVASPCLIGTAGLFRRDALGNVFGEDGDFDWFLAMGSSSLVVLDPADGFVR